MMYKSQKSKKTDQAFEEELMLPCDRLESCSYENERDACVVIPVFLLYVVLALAFALGVAAHYMKVEWFDLLESKESRVLSQKIDVAEKTLHLRLIHKQLGEMDEIR